VRLKTNALNVLGVIPAKGMSTGLPRKNMRLMAGHPMIHYMLSSAIGATMLDEVWVSTDSDEIESYCSNQGAHLLRHDPLLSSEHSPTFGVIVNILRYWESLAKFPDVVVTMRATSPLCLSSDIDKAVRLLLSEDADSVIAVAQSDAHPHRVLVVNNDGFLEHFCADSLEHDVPMRRQDLNPVYVRTGAIYATKREIIAKGSLWGQRALPYFIPKERAVNVNDQVDFFLAEKLLFAQQHAQSH